MTYGYKEKDACDHRCERRPAKDTGIDIAQDPSGIFMNIQIGSSTRWTHPMTKAPIALTTSLRSKI